MATAPWTWVSGGTNGEIWIMYGVSYTSLLDQIEAIMAAHTTDLGPTLASDSTLRAQLFGLHQSVRTLVQELQPSASMRDAIRDWYAGHIGRYPQYLMRQYLDPSAQAWVPYLAGQVWVNLLESEPDSPAQRLFVADTTGATGCYRQMLLGFGMLFIEDNQADTTQQQVIDNLLATLPPAIWNVEVTTIDDFLGSNPPSEVVIQSQTGANIFSNRVGSVSETEFPADSAQQPLVDTFTIADAHEMNHQVDRVVSSGSFAWLQRKYALIQQACPADITFLPNAAATTEAGLGVDWTTTQSHFQTAGFWDGNSADWNTAWSAYWTSGPGANYEAHWLRNNLDLMCTSPQEGFATLSNQYFSNSPVMFDLCLSRWNRGITSCINQFLWFADTYSHGQSQTQFYTIDTQGNITCWNAGLLRNASGYINQIQMPEGTYGFDLDANGFVTALYAVPPGSLTVTLPSAPAGAQWSVDGGAWQNSGATVSALAAGLHTISFNAVAGWNSPPSQQVTITSNATFTSTGTYAQDAPSQLAFVQPPTNAQAGTLITPAVTVAVEDASGKRVATDSSNVTLTIAPNNGLGMLSGTVTRPAVNGIATFNDLSLSQVGAYTLYATDGALTPATSAYFSATSASVTAYSYQTLAVFNGTDGQEPTAPLVMDGSGNLYGAASQGGDKNDGTVFEVPAGGSTITALASFNGTGANGNGGSSEGGLIIDGSGNLYGAGNWGGPTGYGTVFEVAAGSGSIVPIASSFTLASGIGPTAVMMDGSGNLYGTTVMGGANDLGTVFEITAGSSAVTTLGTFDGTNGVNPSILIMDAGGNLYGTAAGDGTHNQGTVFEVAAGSNTITTLVAFNGSNGAQPYAGLVMDSTANFYGTTSQGGDSGNGTVFKIAAGSHAFSTLASFNGTNGSSPFCRLVVDGNGNLYGTSYYGGANDAGTVFELPAGSSTIIPLASFDTNGHPGRHGRAVAGLIMDGNGNLFGTTVDGGDANGDGTVFKLAPTQATKLAFVQPPTGAVAGSTISPAVTLAVEDASGNVVNSDSSSVTVSIGPGSGSGILGGTLTEPAVNGVATFSDLSISAAGTYTLQATDTDNGTGLTPATSGSFTITAQTAGLQVTLLPAAAVAAGAKWSVDGGNTWQLSGATVTGLVVGSQTVSFNSITGWNPPQSQTVTITAGGTTTATGTYVQQTGSVQVTLGPAGAVTAGAEWNVDGGVWQSSGAVVSGLPVGVSHTINYKSITGWNSPSSASVTITNNGTTSVTGTYVEQFGSVTVTLAPATAVTAGAQWNVDGGAWQASGATVGGLSVGSHAVAYYQMTGWASPPSQSVAILNSQTTAVTGMYVVDLKPPAVSCEYPAPGDTYVDCMASIKLRITDAGSGVNLGTVQITASRDGGTTNETICDGSNLTPAAPASSAASAAPYFGCFDATANGNKIFKGKTYIGGTAPSHVFLFEPDTDAAFGFDETVTVSVTATDWAGNTMTPSAATNPPSLYSFTVAPRNFGCNLRVDSGMAGDAFPATATDAAGNIWVAWERDAGATTTQGTIWLAERNDPADAWNFGPEIPVAGYAQNGDYHKPALAITAGGTIYAAYEVHSLPTPAVGVVSATTAAPLTWTQVGPVTGASFALQTAPAITFVNSTNTLCVAGVGADAGGVQQIGVASLAGGASSWTVTPVTSGGSDKSSPAIAQDANGVVYVLWTNTADNNLYGADSSSAWATIHQVTNTGAAGSPAIAAESAGNVLHFVWVAAGGTNPDIQYADTYPAGGWPAPPLTAGASVLNQTGLPPTGILEANYPRIAVTGTTSASANAQVFILWKGRLSNVPGDTDIYFTERMWNGQFYPTPVQVSVVPAGLGLAAESAHNPALGMRLDGTPYAAWTDLRQAGASHICFAETTCAPCQPPPAPVMITPAGTAGGPPAVFTFGTNPHFTEVDVTVPNGALGTSINMMVNELRNPVVECLGGAGLCTDGNGLYLDITGGSGCGGCDSDSDALGDWITVTIHLAPGVTFSSPPAVYRLVPPTVSSLGVYTWTTDLIQNVNYAAGTNGNGGTLSFQTMHLSSFGVGSGASAATGSSGGGGGGGCAISPGGEPDLSLLLLPLAALGVWAGTRLIRRRRSA